MTPAFKPANYQLRVASLRNGQVVVLSTIDSQTEGLSRLN